MSKWTPEPWAIGTGSHVCGAWSGMIRVESPEDFHNNGIEYPDGSTRSFTNVVCGTTGHSETARENILRIVACVNALAGIPDPAAFVERARRIEEAADHADMQAWNLLAHEYGEHFRVSDGDTSKWADKVRAFLAASSALRAALETP